VECETCRRRLGIEQLECPRRNLGEENLCPYRVEQTQLASGEWGCMLFVGLGISLIPITAFLMGEILPFWVVAVMMPLLLVGVIIMGTGVYLKLGKQQTIFNPATGQTWQQTKVFGLPVTQTETSAIEVIPWMSARARVLRYPASVAEFYRGGKVSGLLSTALLQLAAQGVVAIGQVMVYRKFRRPGGLYVLLPGEMYGKVEIQGAIEKQLAVIVGKARIESAEFDHQGKKYSRTHRAVLCLEDVIRMMLEDGQENKDQLLVIEIVMEEAIGLGLGELKGKLVSKFSPRKNTLGKISLDIRSIDQLHHDFWTNQPEHARDLLAKIDLLSLSLTTSKKDTAVKLIGQG
jgi:hypothetical protein